MLWGFVFLSALSAQPAFDVASIKPAELQRRGGEGSLWDAIQMTPLSLTMRNVSLTGCMQWAYGVKEFQVFGPQWAVADRFDIFARTGTPADQAQFRKMLAQLLADRFHLVFRREQRETGVYVLLPGKEKPRMKVSEPDTPNSWSMIRPGLRLDFRHESIGQLADMLSTLIVIGKPVLDRTSIPGFYDFLLDLRELRPPDDREPGASPRAVIDQQLGLRLETRKERLEVLVIERADRTPIAN